MHERDNMESAPDDVRGILGPNERVELYIREKIYRPRINVDSVIITNERIILRHPHALRLKKDYVDYNYQDIVNVILKRGFTRSSLRCTLRLGGDPLLLDDLPNSEAQKAYGIIRENLTRYQSPFTPAAQGVSSVTGGASSAGTPLVACRNCGAWAGPGQKFCGNCGQPL